MNIQEMHNTFRTLGQQMGLQLIRGILPESIDVYLNNAIVELTRQELINGVQVNMQTEQTSNVSVMSKINTFKTLYRTVRYSVNTSEEVDDAYSDKVEYVNKDKGYYIINIPTIDSNITIDTGEYRINPMAYLQFRVEYNFEDRGFGIDCRIINADEVANTLRDYCNGVSKDNPIVVLKSVPVVDELIESNNSISNQQIELYTGAGSHIVRYLAIDYIKTPNVVKYDVDIKKCVNCDLPDFMHFAVVQMAVNLYRQSITGNPIPVRQQQ